MSGRRRRVLGDGAHTRVARGVSLLAAPVCLQVAVEFGDADLDGFDLNAASVIAQTSLAGGAALIGIAWWLDRRWPQSTYGQAVTRLFPLLVFVVIAGGLIANNGIFDQGPNYHIGLAVVLVTCGLIVGWFLRATATPVGRPAPVAQRAPEPVAAHFPAVPPAAPPVAPLGPPPTPPDPVVERSRRRRWAHRVSSGLIALAWVPVGFIFWFAAAWCSVDGALTNRVMIPWGIAQVVGNLTAGYVLDRRVRSNTGVLAAIGRSVLVAVFLWVVSIPWLQQLPGSQGDCG